MSIFDDNLHKTILGFVLKKDGTIVGIETHAIDYSKGSDVNIYHKNIGASSVWGKPIINNKKYYIDHDDKQLIYSSEKHTSSI